MKAMELIRLRKSVRSFDGNPLSKEDAEKILDFARHVENPYRIPIQWKLLDAKQDGLSTRVIVGTDTFLAGKVQSVPRAEEAFGYSFERIVLFAASRGEAVEFILEDPGIEPPEGTEYIATVRIG